MIQNIYKILKKYKFSKCEKNMCLSICLFCAFNLFPLAGIIIGAIMFDMNCFGDIDGFDVLDFDYFSLRHLAEWNILYGSTTIILNIIILTLLSRKYLKVASVLQIIQNIFFVLWFAYGFLLLATTNDDCGVNLLSVFTVIQLVIQGIHFICNSVMIGKNIS